MHIIPLPTRILKPGDDLAALLKEAGEIRDGDIVVVSSKAVATVEGAVVDLRSLKPSSEAQEWSEKTGRSAAFMEATLRETKRMHGKIVGHCPGALLVEVKPDGLREGVLLAANAGMDESNIEREHAAGWPFDSAASATRLRKELGGNIGVIIGDSCCRPARLGVTAYALACSGIDPLVSEVGSQDLYGRNLRVTVEAVADQLTTAANFVMGNAAQSIPAAIVREHGLPISTFEGWVDGIPPEEDLFRGLY